MKWFIITLLFVSSTFAVKCWKCERVINKPEYVRTFDGYKALRFKCPKDGVFDCVIDGKGDTISSFEIHNNLYLLKRIDELENEIKALKSEIKYK